MATETPKKDKLTLAFWIAMGTILLILFSGGCTSTKPETHWGPESREEMQVLIGQTVMDAMFQIHRASLKEMERNRKPGTLRVQAGTKGAE